MSTDDPRPIAADERIAVALSGGGARAMAFHLGTLRALQIAGLLDRVATISAVSGGSVLAGLYCQCPGDFAAFEAKARGVLHRGLVAPALRQAVTSLEGIKALANLVPIAIDRLAAFSARNTFARLAPHRPSRLQWLTESPIPRHHSRTTILRRALSEVFEGQTLTRLRRDRPKLIIVACELRYRSAFYFAADQVGSWRLGTADPNDIELAHAVVASAAYPAFLPALDEMMTFTKEGCSSTSRVILTDGGVYDNLGMAPFWPDRDAGVSLRVDSFDLVIASRAGYALRQSPSPSLWPSRMRAVGDCIHARVENLAVHRAFDLQSSKKMRFLLPYLGQKDQALKWAPSDLVKREQVDDYPTDLSPMPEEMINLLSKRGQQVTTSLIAEHLIGG